MERASRERTMKEDIMKTAFPEQPHSLKVEEGRHKEEDDDGEASEHEDMHTEDMQREATEGSEK